MGPVEGVLVWLLVAVSLVAVGYLLGRTWPARHATSPTRRRARPDSRLDSQRDSQPDSQSPASRHRRQPRPPRQRAMDERLQREMDHVQALRRAREAAEPWRPPAVDAVQVPAASFWFADTAVEPHTRSTAP